VRSVRAGLISLLGFFPLALPAQSLDSAALSAAIEEARSQQVDVLSPRNFQKAVEAQQVAAKDEQRGRSPERVNARLRDGQAALQRAKESAASARQLLDSVIRARQDAVTAQAPKLAGEAWEKAADRFEQAMIENEQGDIRNAQRRAAEAEVLLREAELIAIKAGVLNEARALIAQADEAKVERYAPRTLQAAKRYLAEAEQEIQRNRYDLAAPKRLAARSAYEARHATYLAQLFQRVLEEEGDDQAGLEALVLSWEEPLARMASEMELAPQFDQGIQAAVQELTERVRQQAQEVRRLREEVLHRDEQIADLDEQVRQLEARLGGVAEERIALQRRVDAQERLRANLAKLESMFTSDEARVFRQGDEVVLSLLGIQFPPGRSNIDGNSAALMRKVEQALALFPGASISVEGHTDANGSESANLILSQDRADAVKQYLVQHLGLDPEKVSSIGYGEARPVATNETAQGRARNRRIDLVIHLAPY
jgi:outer membrane protein OmpA-like peptidoglycan-associated protein